MALWLTVELPVKIPLFFTICVSLAEIEWKLESNQKARYYRGNGWAIFSRYLLRWSANNTL